MPNPIAKFSLIFAYLLNLSGALIFALLISHVLKMIQLRFLDNHAIFNLWVQIAFGTMVSGFVITMILKIQNKNHLIRDYAAYLIVLWAIWGTFAIWFGAGVMLWALLSLLLVIVGLGNEAVDIMKLFLFIYFLGHLLFIYQLAKNVWALSGEIERPNTKKLQNKPKLIRIKNHTDD